MPYATRARHVSADQVAATVNNATVQYETDWHAHEEYMILLPRTGGLLVRIQGRGGLLRLNANSFIVVAPGTLHATATTRPQQRHLALYITAAHAVHCARQANSEAGLEGLRRPGVWRLTSALHATLRLRDELAARSGRAATAQLEALDRLLAAESLAVALSTPGILPAVHVREAALLPEIEAYIEAHLSEHLTLEDIAAQFLLSRRHLTRLFRERTSMSVVEFINRQRVARAQRLLSDPATTVLDAALAVGIESPSYLARLFRKYLGHAPGQRRQGD